MAKYQHTNSKYHQASKELGMDVGDYLRELKAETGIADVKLAHDLHADSGITVKQPTIWHWRMGK
jgi:hypothetical protein